MDFKDALKEIRQLEQIALNMKMIVNNKHSIDIDQRFKSLKKEVQSLVIDSNEIKDFEYRISILQQN